MIRTLSCLAHLRIQQSMGRFLIRAVTLVMMLPVGRAATAGAVEELLHLPLLRSLRQAESELNDADLKNFLSTTSLYDASGFIDWLPKEEFSNFHPEIVRFLAERGAGARRFDFNPRTRRFAFEDEIPAARAREWRRAAIPSQILRHASYAAPPGPGAGEMQSVSRFIDLQAIVSGFLPPRLWDRPASEFIPTLAIGSGLVGIGAAGEYFFGPNLLFHLTRGAAALYLLPVLVRSAMSAEAFARDEVWRVLRRRSLKTIDLLEAEAKSLGLPLDQASQRQVNAARYGRDLGFRDTVDGLSDIFDGPVVEGRTISVDGETPFMGACRRYYRKVQSFLKRKSSSTKQTSSDAPRLQ